MSLNGVLKIFLLTVLTLTFSFLPASPKNYSDENKFISIDKSLLKSGDIIFRRGLSFVSNMILMADSKSPYSHTGLIVCEGEKIFVIHTTPDESDDGIDIVKYDLLEDFLRLDRASSTSVYRLSDSMQSVYSVKSVEAAKKFFNEKILFDAALDLSTSDKLYCTELVWKAYLASGLDLIDSKFEYLKIPLSKGSYILPGTLINSPYLKQIISNTQYKE
ncbi:MAG: hypothetical protein IPM56_06665 [Ignavibacteriales bacterium]|nr:MAG: hypothetical protein IPM56_06665 [Ignavibacteriales bacterium]